MATNDWLEEQARLRQARMNAESVYTERARGYLIAVGLNPTEK